jgi:3-deoxy-D-manno-octulosonic-acid transferase
MNFNLNKIKYSFGLLIYLISTRSYFFLIRCLSPFHKRAKALWLGQKSALNAMRNNATENPQPSIWLHVSSLGEYEQGKPILEALKKRYPSYRIVITFFSPSGYQARYKNELADATYYLPFESAKIAADLVQIINPILVIFVKYDLWYNYLKALQSKGIPVILIAALFRENQRFFKKNAVFQRNLLNYFNFIFCQDQNSGNLLEKFGFNNYLISGDTRYDRVSQHLTQTIKIKEIEAFKNKHFLVLVGSSYSIEEQLLSDSDTALGSNRKLIIAPHFTDASRVNEILKRFEPNAVSLKDLLENPEQNSHKKVLVIDRIGWLANLYQYADAAFIGGGYKENGLHNILEAATFGMPICFGPKIERFPEAKEMVSLKLANLILSKEDLKNWLTFHENNSAATANQSLKCRQWIQSKTGATQIIINWIKVRILP